MIYLKNEKPAVKIAVVFISLCQGLQFSISPVLKDIQMAHPSVGISTVQMLITVPALLSLVVAITSGWLVSRMSKKRILLFGTLVLGVFGLLPLLRDSFALLFVSRAVLGIGFGISTALITAVIADHFEGRERASAMGLQGASVGSGMLLSTGLGGLLGSIYYKYAYFIHIIAFISAVVIWICLPDKKTAIQEKANKIRLNKAVLKLSLIAGYEFFFLLTFTTNIAIHLSGKLAGEASVAGLLTGIFSGIQIVAGLLLGRANRLLGDNIMPAAIFSFAVGCALLVFFPATLPPLLLGAVFCGISQGLFAPQAMFQAANAVEPLSAAMAAACVTGAMNLSQLVSPYILNALSRSLFGEATTTNVYTIAMVCMAAFPVLLMIARQFARRSK